MCWNSCGGRIMQWGAKSTNVNFAWTLEHHSACVGKKIQVIQGKYSMGKEMMNGRPEEGHRATTLPVGRGWDWPTRNGRIFPLRARQEKWGSLPPLKVKWNYETSAWHGHFLPSWGMPLLWLDLSCKSEWKLPLNTSSLLFLSPCHHIFPSFLSFSMGTFLGKMSKPACWIPLRTSYSYPSSKKHFI